MASRVAKLRPRRLRPPAASSCGCRSSTRIRPESKHSMIRSISRSRFDPRVFPISSAARTRIALSACSLSRFLRSCTASTLLASSPMNAAFRLSSSASRREEKVFSSMRIMVSPPIRQVRYNTGPTATATASVTSRARRVRRVMFTPHRPFLSLHECRGATVSCADLRG